MSLLYSKEKHPRLDPFGKPSMGRVPISRSESSKPCALCLFRVGFGVKAVSRFTHIPQTTAKRLRQKHGIAKRTRKTLNVTQKKMDIEKIATRLIMAEYAREANVLRKYDEQHWSNHTEAINGRQKIYYRNNRISILARDSLRAKTDANFKLKRTLRTRIWKVLNDFAVKKTNSTLELTGCDIMFLRVWIEGKFEKGMKWSNQGQWEIDHIIPCSSFDLTNPTQQRQCFHYSNLRPLWVRDNRSKHARIITCQPELPMPI